MHRKIIAAVSAVTLTSLLAGCAGNPSTDNSPDELQTVTVGVLPIVTTAAFRLGVEEGYFEEEGLDVQIAEAQSGAAITASVISGEYDVGFSAIVPQIQAVEENLPIQVIGTASSVSNNAGLVAAPNSDIEKPEDLEGARIGVVAMESIDELSARGAADEIGVDSSSFNMVSIPFPEMLPALEAGRIDAAMIVEPFYTSALERDFKVIIEEPMGHFLEDEATNAAFFSSNQKINEDQEVIDAFIRALEKSNQEATDNPDKIAELVPTYTSIPEDVAKKMIPMVYGTSLTKDSYETFGELMVKYGLLNESPDIDTLIYDGALLSED